MSSMFGDAGVDMLLNEVLAIETKIKNIFQAIGKSQTFGQLETLASNASQLLLILYSRLQNLLLISDDLTEEELRMRVAARARQLFTRHSMLELALRDTLLERRSELLSSKHPTPVARVPNTTNTQPLAKVEVSNQTSLEDQPNERHALLGLTHRPLAVRSAERELTEHIYSVARLMHSEVARSEATLEELYSSSMQLTQTGSQLGLLGGAIRHSRGLLAKLARREFADFVLIIFALLFFVAVVFYIAQKRALPGSDSIVFRLFRSSRNSSRSQEF